MNQNGRRPISELLADRELIDAAVRRAAYRAILQHAREGREVPTLEQGKVVWIPASEILARLDRESNGPASD